MAISAEHAGRSYPPTAPYEVSAAKIAEFAAALGEEGNPAYAGDTPIAPPTLAAIVAAAAWHQMFDDPELEISLPRMVHGDQRFRYVRPIRVGDVLTAALTIDRVRVRQESEIISCSVGIYAGDELVCAAENSFFHAREALS